MNIIFFCDFYPTNINPYGGSFFHNFAKGLARIGHKVYVFNINNVSIKYYKNINKYHETIDNVEIYVHKIIKVPKLKLFNYFLLYLTTKKYLKSIQKRQKKIDIFHIHFIESDLSEIALKLARSYKIPTILTEHSSSFSIPDWEYSNFNKYKEKLAQFTLLSTVSPTIVNAFKKNLNKEVHYIANCVDENIFFPYRNNKNSDNNNNDKTYKFITSGFLTKRKNIDTLIKAIKKIKEDFNINIYLEIIGDGEERENLEALTKQLELSNNIIFLGNIHNSTIPCFLNKADYFILVSHSETFGVVVLEALFCGLPVLATKCGGPEYFVRDGIDGYLCENDIDSIVRGIIKLINSNIKIDIKYFIDHYSTKKVAKDLELLYQKAINLYKKEKI